MHQTIAARRARTGTPCPRRRHSLLRPAPAEVEAARILRARGVTAEQARAVAPLPELAWLPAAMAVLPS